MCLASGPFNSPHVLLLPHTLVLFACALFVGCFALRLAARESRQRPWGVPPRRSHRACAEAKCRICRRSGVSCAPNRHRNRSPVLLGHLGWGEGICVPCSCARASIAHVGSASFFNGLLAPVRRALSSVSTHNHTHTQTFPSIHTLSLAFAHLPTGAARRRQRRSRFALQSKTVMLHSSTERVPQALKCKCSRSCPAWARGGTL